MLSCSNEPAMQEIIYLLLVKRRRVDQMTSPRRIVLKELMLNYVNSHVLNLYILSVLIK